MVYMFCEQRGGDTEQMITSFIPPEKRNSHAGYPELSATCRCTRKECEVLGRTSSDATSIGFEGPVGSSMPLEMPLQAFLPLCGSGRSRAELRYRARPVQTLATPFISQGRCTFHVRFTFLDVGAARTLRNRLGFLPVLRFLYSVGRHTRPWQRAA